MPAATPPAATPPVPVLLVTGFLGAGKTTVVNHLLANADGRRIAAVVNDFGAINIDAELIAGASDGVVSLSNGCICCSLEGDLLRTLASILRRAPRPEAIVIETSGIADPADIVRNLMDPVIWRHAPLETVLCVIDAASVPRTAGATSAPRAADGPSARRVADATSAGALDDPLLSSQVRTADIVALSKLDLTGPEEQDRVRRILAATNPRAVVVDAVHGHVPLALLFPDNPAEPPVPRDPGRPRPVADRFESTSWTYDHPLSLAQLQGAIERLAPKLARAKGIFETVEHPGRRLLLQFSGGRATLAPAGPGPAQAPTCRIVFIAEIGVLPAAEIDQAMAGCIAH